MASIIRKLTINRGFEFWTFYDGWLAKQRLKLIIPMKSHRMLWLPVLELDLDRLQLFMVKLGMVYDWNTNITLC